MDLFSMAISLFLLMDSVGNIPVFLSILKEINPKRQRFIILRELFIALVFMISFYFAGNYFLTFLGISQPAVLISGGIILLIIAIRMVFPVGKKAFVDKQEQEPLLVPLAVPLISGPAVLAAIVLYSHQKISPLICIGAIFIAWSLTTIILIFSPFLKKLLGNRGLDACERFTGLVLIMIAVQMFLNGIFPFINNK